MAFVGVFSKVAFAGKVPLLLKATSDDPNPTPGYLFDEIAKISNESLEHCYNLVAFLADRVLKKSYHVKLKTLLVIKAVLEKGNPEFREALSKQADGIREAKSYTGPPDALYGDQPYIDIRRAASTVLELTFNVDRSGTFAGQNPTVYGSSTQSGGKRMEGFGNSVVTNDSSRGTFSNTVRKIASYIPESLRGISSQSSTDPNYQPYAEPELKNTTGFARNPPDMSSQYSDISYPRQIPNGELQWNSANDYRVREGTIDWREVGKAHSLQLDGTDRNLPNIKSSQEVKIVNELTSPGGVKLRLSKDETDNFLKRCSTLNLAKIVTCIRQKLGDQNAQVQLRSLMLVESLWESPIEEARKLIKEECFGKLTELKETGGSAVKSKADKILLSINPHVREPVQMTIVSQGNQHSAQANSVISYADSGELDHFLSTTTSQKWPPESTRTESSQKTGIVDLEGIFSGLKVADEGASIEHSPTVDLANMTDIFSQSGGINSVATDKESTQTEDYSCNFGAFVTNTSGSTSTQTAEVKELKSSAFDLLELDPYFSSNTAASKVEAITPDLSRSPLPLANTVSGRVSHTQPNLGMNPAFIVPHPASDQRRFLVQSDTNKSSDRLAFLEQDQSNLISLPSSVQASPFPAQSPVSYANSVRGMISMNPTISNINRSVGQPALMSPHVHSQSTTPLRLPSQPSTGSSFDFISKRGDAFDFVKEAMEASKKK